MLCYAVKVPFSAFQAGNESDSTAVTLPVNAEFELLPRRRDSLLGMVHIAWQGREYAIFEKDLHQKCTSSHQRQQAVPNPA
jgi:hypothetical protein